MRKLAFNFSFQRLGSEFLFLKTLLYNYRNFYSLQIDPWWPSQYCKAELQYAFLEVTIVAE